MKKAENEEMNGMKSVQGQCRFCKQFMAIEVPESFNEIDIEDEVTKRCDCADAKADTRIKENIANTEGAIKEFFKDKPELQEVKDLLLAAVKPMAEFKISKIGIAKGGYSGSMKPTKDGIKITLKYTTEDSVES